MNHTDIEYLVNPDGSKGYCWNFHTGCSHDKTVCPVADKCWARGMSHRFSRSFEPTLHPEKLLDPLSLKKPARIGVCFTGDLFGDWVDPYKLVDYKIPINKSETLNPNKSLCRAVMDVINVNHEHQFFFLTKAPQNYRKWGAFPNNAWCGMTICNNNQRVLSQEFGRLEARHKWISFEPLMERIDITSEGLSLAGISWVVIGGWSGGKNSPPLNWVWEIIDACNGANIPVFLKSNLGGIAKDFKQLPSNQNIPI